MANDQFPTPRPTDPVPSAKSTVINDDALVLDYVVNSTGTVTTRTGKILLTLDEAQKKLIKYQPFVPLNGGVWASGQTYTAYNEYMIYNGEAYSPLPATVLPYTVGAVPDLGFVYQIQLNDHSKLSNLNVVGGHDSIYRRGVTTAKALASELVSIGDTVYLSDRGMGKFNYVSGEAANGFDILAHDTLPLQLKLIDSTPINAAHYGITWAIGGSGLDVTDALNYFLSKAKKSIVPQGDYATSSMITVPAGCNVDFSGSNIYTTLPATEWAMLVQSFDASNRAQAHNFQLINVQTAASAPPESEWRHGLCLGGSNGIVSNHREQNYSGISLALGNDTVYGTTCPAVTRCYYWDIGQTNVASMYGVNLYIGVACNDNHFQTFGTFPWNGFNQSPPRASNCIYEIQNLGKSNSFGGAINLEAAPSTNKVLLTADCQNTVCESLFYCEHNASWIDDVTSIFSIEEQSAGNVFVARYAGQKKFIVDDGTANLWSRLADFYINAPVENSPRSVKNLVENPDFTDGFVLPWSTFSTGVDSAAVNVGGGFVSGDSYIENYTAGRPNILQRIDGNIVNLEYLKGKTITVTCMIKASVPTVRVKIAGVGGGAHSGGGAWERVSATSRIIDSATSVNLQVISESNPAGTGFVEISNCVAIVGTEIFDIV